MTRRVRACLLTMLLALPGLTCSGCLSADTLERVYVLDVAEDKGEATYLGIPLRTGQILVAEAGSPYSLFFSLGTERYYDFTHAALIVMEDGKPWVYEMTGEYKPGFDDAVTDGIEGGCQKSPLMKYAAAYLYLEVYDPPAGCDGEAVGRWARKQFEEQPPFDAYFDYREHQRLFCSEFVQMGLEAGGAPELELAPVRQQPSLQQLLAWLKVQPDYALPAGLLAEQGSRVAALGQLPSSEAARGYFAAKKELHRRFTPDQQLGNLFLLDGAELVLRGELMVFLEKATGLIHEEGKGLTQAEIDAKVQALAAELFGEGPTGAQAAVQAQGG